MQKFETAYPSFFENIVIYESLMMFIDECNCMSTGLSIMNSYRTFEDFALWTAERCQRYFATYLYLSLSLSFALSLRPHTSRTKDDKFQMWNLKICPPPHEEIQQNTTSCRTVHMFVPFNSIASEFKFNQNLSLFQSSQDQWATRVTYRNS